MKRAHKKIIGSLEWMRAKRKQDDLAEAVLVIGGIVIFVFLCYILGFYPKWF